MDCPNVKCKFLPQLHTKQKLLKTWHSEVLLQRNLLYSLKGWHCLKSNTKDPTFHKSKLTWKSESMYISWALESNIILAIFSCCLAVNCKWNSSHILHCEHWSVGGLYLNFQASSTWAAPPHVGAQHMPS